MPLAAVTIGKKRDAEMQRCFGVCIAVLAFSGFSYSNLEPCRKLFQGTLGAQRQARKMSRCLR